MLTSFCRVQKLGLFKIKLPGLNFKLFRPGFAGIKCGLNGSPVGIEVAFSLELESPGFISLFDIGLKRGTIRGFVGKAAMFGTSPCLLVKFEGKLGLSLKIQYYNTINHFTD